VLTDDVDLPSIIHEERPSELERMADTEEKKQMEERYLDESIYDDEISDDHDEFYVPPAKNVNTITSIRCNSESNDDNVPSDDQKRVPHYFSRNPSRGDSFSSPSTIKTEIHFKSENNCPISSLHNSRYSSR